ncbi:MAG TPA: hemolysin family protein [Actinomycetota bacterium]|nr:hemolysin family protein [Actinomycetota bacterium]
MTWFQGQLVLAGLAVLAAFLTSAWVNAISRLSKLRAMRLAEEKATKRAHYLTEIANNPPTYLTSVLLVMLFFRVAATVLVTGAVLRLGPGWPELLAIAIMTFVLFQLAEIAPRTWALERLDQVLLGAAAPAYLIGKVLGPLATVLVKAGRVFLLILPGRGLPKGPLMSEEEIKSMLDVAESEEVIEADEREMIHSIFEFTDTVVREVMVPRPDMVCVDGSASLEAVLELTLKQGFSRVPVTGGSIDNVIGIIYQKDVVKKLQSNGRNRSRKASEVKREATFVPESKKVSELLREMQRSKTHMVIVVDEYGGVAGLATLEDLLEEIVGEISDEYDRDDPDVVVLDDGTLRVSARLSIEELNEILGTELPHIQWDSVGGLVGGLLGRLPVPGDVVSHEGVEFEVQKMNGRRIAHLLIRGGTVKALAAQEGS